MATMRNSWTGAGRAAAFALLAALAGCSPLLPAPPERSGTADDALKSHAQWCGTNPPSGYCTIDDKR